jgi:integrase
MARRQSYRRNHGPEDSGDTPSRRRAACYRERPPHQAVHQLDLRVCHRDSPCPCQPYAAFPRARNTRKTKLREYYGPDRGRHFDTCNTKLPRLVSYRYRVATRAMLFLRPGELRAAEWAEFELADALWRIPAARMKMKSPHLVPLSRQAIALLTSNCVVDRSEAADGLGPAGISQRTWWRPSHEFQHVERSAAHARVFKGADDLARLSTHGIHPAERAGLESRCNRAAARPFRAKFDACRLQRRRVSARSQENDAVVGRQIGCTCRHQKSGDAANQDCMSSIYRVSESLTS